MQQHVVEVKKKEVHRWHEIMNNRENQQSWKSPHLDPRVRKEKPSSLLLVRDPRFWQHSEPSPPPPDWHHPPVGSQRVRGSMTTVPTKGGLCMEIRHDNCNSIIIVTAIFFLYNDTTFWKEISIVVFLLELEAYVFTNLYKDRTAHVNSHRQKQETRYSGPHSLI